MKAGLTKGGAPAAVDTSAAAKPAAPAAKPAAPVAKPAQAPKADAAPKAAAAPKNDAAPKADKGVNSWTGSNDAKPAKGGNYTVKSGDTLSSIAAAQGLDWHDLYKNNAKVVGGNPDLIFPGQTLSI